MGEKGRFGSNVADPSLGRVVPVMRILQLSYTPVFGYTGVKVGADH